jgi:hypothetical protein
LSLGPSHIALNIHIIGPFGLKTDHRFCNCYDQPRDQMHNSKNNVQLLKDFFVNLIYFDKKILYNVSFSQES